MKLDKETIQAIVFNVAETILIVLVGLTLNLSFKLIIGLMLVFMVSRACFGTTLHFKDWYRCLIWSLLILFSLFSVLKQDIVISVLFTIFSAYIMTGRANIQDMYLWNNKDDPGKYHDVEEFIKYNEFNDLLIEFEKKLSDKNSLEYLVYKYRFKDEKSFGDISKLLKLSNPRIVEILDRISFAMRLYCKF